MLSIKYWHFSSCGADMQAFEQLWCHKWLACRLWCAPSAEVSGSNPVVGDGVHSVCSGIPVSALRERLSIIYISDVLRLRHNRLRTCTKTRRFIAIIMHHLLNDSCPISSSYNIHFSKLAWVGFFHIHLVRKMALNGSAHHTTSCATLSKVDECHPPVFFFLAESYSWSWRTINLASLGPLPAINPNANQIIDLDSHSHSGIHIPFQNPQCIIQQPDAAFNYIIYPALGEGACSKG